MKFGVSYNRKVKAGLAYEMLEIGLWVEHDSALNSPDKVLHEIKSKVNSWIDEERDRLLKKSVKRPEVDK